MHLIPYPKKCEIKESYYSLPANPRVYFSHEAESLHEVTSLLFEKSSCIKIKTANSAAEADICFILEKTDLKNRGISSSESTEENSKGSYVLSVTESAITIKAHTKEGLFNALQTLLQIVMECSFPINPNQQRATSVSIPQLEIEDRPALAWRGVMLDSSRYFQSVDWIKKFIDALALHKINVLHWHLTDDQGWRIEIKRYPKLTQVGSHRSRTVQGHIGKKFHHPYYDETPYGGYYTQAELRELVAYAAARMVTIVPEIDMPGHMQAAIAAYPELGCTKEEVVVKEDWGVCSYIMNPFPETIEFCKNVLAEVIDIFPSEYIHIGGDEAEKSQWRASKKIQEMRRSLFLSNEEELQGWFLKQIETFLADHGRKMIGWDEILQGGVRTSTAVMSWRGIEGAINATKNGHKAVMASQSHNYFDYYQWDPKQEPLAIGTTHDGVVLTCRRVYDFNPWPESLTEKDCKNLMGLQGQIWTEYMPSEKVIEYMAFPRLCALAENGWLADGGKDWGRFKSSIAVQKKRLTRYGFHYYNGPLE